MRNSLSILSILTFLALLMTGCSVLDFGTDKSEPDHQIENIDSDLEKTETSNENNNEDPELTEEEKLIMELPASASAEDWNLILVNPWKALPEDYEVELVKVNNEQQIDVRIEEAWNNWYEAALSAGHRLFFASGYRGIERQRSNFNSSVQSYMNEGFSEEEAIEKSKEYLTEPGHSEHHTGLALDIVDEEWIVAGNGLETEYEAQASQQWLVSTMADYGFILRYPQGKEEITGINYEPWHFRYVGVESAQFMIEHDLTLEEYTDLLNKKVSN